MKRILSLTFILFVFQVAVFAQEPETITLRQTKGEFVQKKLKLKEGSYVFEIENNGVDHPVGFVLAPEGKTDQANHIKEAYVKETVNDGEIRKSSVVKLTKGTYTYFCPLNPTPQYTLVVK